MGKITTFLWFEHEAVQAADFYTSIFPDAKLLDTERQVGDSGPNAPGEPLVVNFELFGQPFAALNGGEHTEFNDAVSFAVDCADQQEVDYYWEKLLADGGQPVQCGWLIDRYGVRWQIVPHRLLELQADPDPEKARRVVEAMLRMGKIDVATLEEAHRG